SSGSGKTQLHNGSAKNARAIVLRIAARSPVVAQRTSSVTAGDGTTVRRARPAGARRSRHGWRSALLRSDAAYCRPQEGGDRSRRVTHDTSDLRPDRPRRVAIIGAGPGGICTGVRLLERGHRDFVILEKAPGIGGTWWHNRYPGAECDIKSHLYSFSFAPN